jgi:aryl-alcohol dehydrogenase-like predicted oxidoreductase
VIIGKTLRDFTTRDEVVLATRVYFEKGSGPNGSIRQLEAAYQPHLVLGYS